MVTVESISRKFCKLLPTIDSHPQLEITNEINVTIEMALLRKNPFCIR